MGLKQIKQNWENKLLHGKYPMRSQKDDVDQGNTHQWLRSAGLKAETEGFIMQHKIKAILPETTKAKL